MFDFLTFLRQEIGDVNAVVTLFERYGLAGPNISAVYKWTQRGVVPSDWFALILALLELENGQPTTVAKYIKGSGNAR